MTIKRLILWIVTGPRKSSPDPIVVAAGLYYRKYCGHKVFTFKISGNRTAGSVVKLGKRRRSWKPSPVHLSTSFVLFYVTFRWLLRLNWLTDCFTLETFIVHLNSISGLGNGQWRRSGCSGVGEKVVVVVFGHFYFIGDLNGGENNLSISIYTTLPICVCYCDRSVIKWWKREGQYYHYFPFNDSPFPILVMEFHCLISNLIVYRFPKKKRSFLS